MKSVAALLGLLALGISLPIAAEHGTPAPLDPTQARGVQYLAMSNEVARQQARLEANFVATRGRIIAEIDRRREALHAATDDEIERSEWGRLLDELRRDSISELRREFEVCRGQLNDLRRRATAALSSNGMLDEATWDSISVFSASNTFDIPRSLVSAPEFDLNPMYDGFPAAIYDCSAFEETFPHPVTSEPMKRNVHGVVDGRCHYEEEMPAMGRLICLYSLERLDAIADYHANLDTYERLEPVSRNDFVAGQAITTTTWTLDGEPYEHPIDAAMSAGECVVHGFGGGDTESPAVAELED